MIEGHDLKLWGDELNKLLILLYCLCIFICKYVCLVSDQIDMFKPNNMVESFILFMQLMDSSNNVFVAWLLLILKHVANLQLIIISEKTIKGALSIEM